MLKNANNLTWLDWLEKANFGSSYKITELLQAWKDAENPKKYINPKIIKNE